jgi:hypothetical protein
MKLRHGGVGRRLGGSFLIFAILIIVAAGTGWQGLVVADAGVDTTQAGVSRSKEAASELSHMSGELHTLVARFQL